ncbi:MAG: Gfo/Idh/MocA family oxidoreductase [Betaproteobacteria bacterium AqS2]|uniref:Gfo/Idh/MocA family oxidoreductase n=1 Tax=Candidatus Amphirhobacter heronislandensis TaxID=1732024 RepID=A0A930XXT6_9GAMM|nr:Gfo/Idh/MocA family oxidoreductase [Betaproteobacteria bacterium AqS2]
MKVGVVGLGLRASMVLGYLKAELPELEVMGYVDPQPCGLERLAQTTPVGPALPDLAALLKQKPEFLFVMSPNHLHLEHIRAGLEAGVRMFAEKPIVVSPEQTFALAELLAQHGTAQVQVGLVLRYARHARDLRAAQEAGLLGDVVSIEANEHIAPYHGAFFMRDWRRLSKYSGGFMLEKCCHDLDIYNMVTGSRPLRVASFGGRSSFTPAHAPDSGADAVYQEKKSHWESAADSFASDADIVDNQVAIVEYASGARLAFHTNSNVPDEHRRFCVIGTKGMAEGDFGRGFLKITDAHSRQALKEHDYTDCPETSVHYGADELMARDLAAYLRGERPELPVSVVDCMEAGLAAMAIDQARASGQVVDLRDWWDRLDACGLRKS